jgi:GMP synthase-like glutamine amidotransferase
MILIINICKHELHYREFVAPIEDILKSREIPFTTKKFYEISKTDIESSHRIIITGTSLRDFEYSKLNNSLKFKFLKNYNKPILAICGGMQLLCSIYGCKMVDGLEIGLKKLDFNAEFLGINGSREVYELHNKGILVDEKLRENFKLYAKTEFSKENHIKSSKRSPNKDTKKTYHIAKAVVHKHFKHYGTLFHPEVRNKDLIVNFLYV